jgi:glucose/arabinose dehydrogenase
VAVEGEGTSSIVMKICAVHGWKSFRYARGVLDGFVNADGEALGRPVGVAVDRSGALLVADDVGNVI